MARKGDGAGDSTTAKAAEVRSLLQRYRQLTRHVRPDLKSALRLVRDVQLDAFREAHRADFDRAGYRDLFDYYADALHGGLDLDAAASDGERAFGLLAHMDESYVLMRNALEFSVLAQELDDALAVAGATSATQLHIAGQHAARLRQMALLTPLVSGLAVYARSRLARAAFKLALVPLRATSLAPLVRVLDRGYDILIRLDDVEPHLARLIDNNRRAIDGLYR